MPETLQKVLQICVLLGSSAQTIETEHIINDDLVGLKSFTAQDANWLFGPKGLQMAYLYSISDLAYQQSSGPSYCDVDLGCFSTKDPDFWHPLHRPLNFLPKSRERIRTKYLLYTRSNPGNSYALRPAPKGQPLTDLGPLDLRKKIKLIVQGWIDSPSFISWMEELKDQLLLNDDVNVIIVDWTYGNGFPYTGAVANARVVGAETALLLENLQFSGADVGHMHIIGHSLGSHVAGYAGERLRGLGRITALDPAGPFFQGMPPAVRLDPTDALLVDAWHTDGGPLLKMGLGMDEAVGHIDFYPNGGKEQPGCKSQRVTSIVTDGLVMGVRRFLGCNHERAIQLYLKAVNAGKGSAKSCTAWAFPCPDWATFISGHCAICGAQVQQCATMDHEVLAPGGSPFLNQMVNRTTNSSIKLYLRTNSEPPYCVYHYQITLRMASVQSSRSESGSLFLHVVDANGRTQRLTLSKSGDIHPGATYRYLLTSGQPWDLGRQKVRLEWKSNNILSIVWKPKLYVQDVIVKFMNPSLDNNSGNPPDGEIWAYRIPEASAITSGQTTTLVQV